MHDYELEKESCRGLTQNMRMKLPQKHNTMASLTIIHHSYHIFHDLGDFGEQTWLCMLARIVRV